MLTNPYKKGSSEPPTLDLNPIPQCHVRIGPINGFGFANTALELNPHARELF